MELILALQSETEVSVTCDSQPSHTFDPRPLLLKHEQDLQKNPIVYGEKLYNALFPQNTLAQRTLATSPERILLVTISENLDAIPWEYAYGPDNFLVLECPFVRGLPAEQRIAPPSLDSSLHIIVVPSNPLSHDVEALDIDAEWMRLKEIIQEVPSTITLERTRPPTLVRTRELVANQKGRIVHFMGHGGQDKQGALLCFEKDNGDLDKVRAERFMQCVRGSVFLVTLNACVSAKPGPTSFSNLAATLVRQKMPYALGMRLSIYEDDARIFSRTFYSELARGTSVEEAVFQARLTLSEKSSGHWVIGVPVLYTALTEPAAGFSYEAGKPTVKAYQSSIPIEVTALPRAEGTFQGRIDELKQLGTYLTDDKRRSLVTLHGGGGQGKTALAREAIERFAYAWPGGVWATTLENLPSRATFVIDLARFLGIPTRGILDPKEVEQQVLARLAHRRTLIVLDNAETLVEAVEADNQEAVLLAQFIREQLPRPPVSLLTTSRSHLGWSDEVAIELVGLEPPEGIKLFKQHAPQRREEIDKDEALVLVWELSEKVEGHPLSLRLLSSAFNVSSRSLQEFVEEYKTQLLSAENKYAGLDHRHRTLYASIETSVRYLSDELRSLLSGLWIFHAPFLEHVAIAIFDSEAEEAQQTPSPVQKYLYTLWQRGLLTCRTEPAQDGSLKFYYLLPTTRPYVEDHLEQADEREALLVRFGVAYSQLAAWLYQNMYSRASAFIIAQQTREDLKRGVSYVPEEVKGYYLLSWGCILNQLESPQQALRLLEEALEAAQEEDQKLEVAARRELARVCRDTGQLQRALQHYQQMLPLVDKSGNRMDKADALHDRGRIYYDMGQTQEAIKLYEQALSIAREEHYRTHEGLILNDIAVAYDTIGQTQEALEFYQQALLILQEEGYRAGVATALTNIAKICDSLGLPQKALQFYKQALPIRRELGDKIGEAATLGNMAHVYQLLGQSQEALDLCHGALSIQKRIDDRSGEAKTLLYQAEVYHGTGQRQEALRLGEEALTIQEEIGNPDGEADALNIIAAIYESRGQPQEALRLYQRALPLKRQVNDRAGEATTLGGIGGCYQSTGQPQEALRLYKQALSLAQAVNYRVNVGTMLNNIGEVYESIGQQQRALEFFEQALPILRELNYKAGEANILNNMAGVYNNTRQPQKALQLCEQALSIQRAVSDRNGEATTLVHMAVAYRTMENPHEALRLCQQALPILHEVEDHVGESTALHNMAAVYQILGQRQEALQLYQQALCILGEANYPSGETKVLNGMAYVYQADGQLQEALQHYKQALLIEKRIEDRGGEATTLYNIGTIHIELRQWHEALQYFREALPIIREVSDKLLEAAALNSMAFINCAVLKQPQEALHYCQQALSIARQLGSQASESTAFSSFALAYYFMGEQPKAVAYMKRAIALLKEASLSQDSSGQTLDVLESTLQKMGNGTLLKPSGEGRRASTNAQTRAFSTLPGDLLQMSIERTVESMTTKSHGRLMWRRLMEKALQDAQQQGDDWQIEVDFFTAIIDILDGRSAQLPEGHPYAPAVKTIRQSITRYRGRDDALTPQEEKPDILEHVIRNTIAVLGPIPEVRGEWRSRLVELSNLALQSKAQHLAAFVSELIRLLDANGNPKGLGTNLHEAYAEIWQDIVNQVAAYRDDVR